MLVVSAWWSVGRRTSVVSKSISVCHSEVRRIEEKSKNYEPL